MMTFSGLVFSVTILVLQQASNQFSPRVLRTFLKDRRSQLVLGIFVGTFVYALLGLRSVRGTAEGIESYVPSLSVWLAVVLVLLCVGTFIYYIHHVAQSIRAVVILTRIRDETHRALERMYPEGVGEDTEEAQPKRPEGPPSLLVTYPGTSGVLVAVDEEQRSRRRRKGMLFDNWQGLGRVALVGVCAYVALVLMLRLSGNRTLSKLNAFDFVVTVALGSTLATVLLSKDVALAEGLLAFAVLIGLQFLVTWTSVHVSWFNHLVKSEPVLLFHQASGRGDGRGRGGLAGAGVRARGAHRARPAGRRLPPEGRTPLQGVGKGSGDLG
jgi:hypothetical protein